MHVWYILGNHYFMFLPVKVWNLNLSTVTRILTNLRQSTIMSLIATAIIRNFSFVTEKEILDFVLWKKLSV